MQEFSILTTNSCTRSVIQTVENCCQKSRDSNTENVNLFFLQPFFVQSR